MVVLDMLYQIMKNTLSRDKHSVMYFMVISFVRFKVYSIVHMHVDLGLIDWLYKKADGFAIFTYLKIKYKSFVVFECVYLHTIFVFSIMYLCMQVGK